MHGYLSSPQSFSYQLGYFSREFEVFAPSFKGFGDNKGMEYPYSLDDYILELNEYFYKNGIVRPHIVAHSFGARVAIKASYQNPEIFDKLVLTGAAGLKPKETFKKKLKKATFKALSKFVKREKLKRFYSKDYLALDGVMKESFKKIVSEHLDYTLDFIKNQTLIVFGKSDKETPLYMAEKFNSRIQNSKMLILQGAGHFCFIDKPHKFNTEVREFLLSGERYVSTRL